MLSLHPTLHPNCKAEYCVINYQSLHTILHPCELITPYISTIKYAVSYEKLLCTPNIISLKIKHLNS